MRISFVVTPSLPSITNRAMSEYVNDSAVDSTILEYRDVVDFLMISSSIPAVSTSLTGTLNNSL